MTYFHNYPITGLYVLYKQFWQDLKLQLQCECLNDWIWSQDTFAYKISEAEMLCFWLHATSFLDSGSRGRVWKYCFQSLPRAGLVGPRLWVGNLPSRQAAVQDAGTALTEWLLQLWLCRWAAVNAACSTELRTEEVTASSEVTEKQMYSSGSSIWMLQILTKYLPATYLRGNFCLRNLPVYYISVI